MNLCSRFHQIKDLGNPCEIPVSTLSALCLSIVVLVAVECHALKRCTFWRETCLASVFALRLATQRARAANRSAKDIVSQKI